MVTCGSSDGNKRQRDVFAHHRAREYAVISGRGFEVLSPGWLPYRHRSGGPSRRLHRRPLPGSRLEAQGLGRQHFVRRGVTGVQGASASQLLCGVRSAPSGQHGALILAWKRTLSCRCCSRDRRRRRAPWTSDSRCDRQPLRYLQGAEAAVNGVAGSRVLLQRTSSGWTSTLQGDRRLTIENPCNAFPFTRMHWSPQEG